MVFGIPCICRGLAPRTAPVAPFNLSCLLRVPRQTIQRMRGVRIMPRAGDGVEEWIADNMQGGRVQSTKFLGGSNWSSAYLYQTGTGSTYFVKTARGTGSDEMFAGEALGLRAIHGTCKLRVPEVFHYGRIPSGSGSFIVMEYLQLGGRVDQAELGRRLAHMHLAEPGDPSALAGKFGFACDNTIGGTLQPNAWSDSWVDFFRDQRLMHQIRLTKDARLMQLGEALCKKLSIFFEGIEIRPSILHGDLWSGNIASVGGVPCVFDPACYWGHHEAEFGMSWCAGFTAEFWTAYHQVIPRARGWEARRQLYSLYHYLNHYNLFGGGYYSSCEQMLTQLSNAKE